jgi:spermidine/putrescine ABC transporter ATP-binding subunit
MSSVSLESVYKSYGGTDVVRKLNLEIAEGEFVVLLGPSGCGKTTTLRMIAGFVDPSRGSIRIGGKVVNSVPPRLRDIGMVFQSYALFPHMTVAENIGFGLRQRKVPRAASAARVQEMLEMIHLSAYAHHNISRLSGGQQQRVALARAIAPSPSLLLMDEPLGALDQKLREELQVELLRLQRHLKITTVLVTHDQQEAMVLADRIVIMANGTVQQIGTPEELYHQPTNQFVADFIGKSNLMKGRLVRNDGHVLIDFGVGIKLPVDSQAVHARSEGNELMLGIRPEHLEFTTDSTQGPLIPGTIEQVQFLGQFVRYLVRTPWDQVLTAERSGHEPVLAVGSVTHLRWSAAHARWFGLDGERA